MHNYPTLPSIKSILEKCIESIQSGCQETWALVQIIELFSNCFTSFGFSFGVCSLWTSNLIYCFQTKYSSLSIFQDQDFILYYKFSLFFIIVPFANIVTIDKVTKLLRLFSVCGDYKVIVKIKLDSEIYFKILSSGIL